MPTEEVAAEQKQIQEVLKSIDESVVSLEEEVALASEAEEDLTPKQDIAGKAERQAYLIDLLCIASHKSGIVSSIYHWQGKWHSCPGCIENTNEIPFSELKFRPPGGEVSKKNLPKLRISWMSAR